MSLTTEPWRNGVCKSFGIDIPTGEDGEQVKRHILVMKGISVNETRRNNAFRLNWNIV